MTTLLASRGTIGLDSPTLLQDLTTHQLDDVLTPLTAEELEVDGGNWLTDFVGGGLAVIGGMVLPETAPIWMPIAIGVGAGILIDRGIYDLSGWW